MSYENFSEEQRATLNDALWDTEFRKRVRRYQFAKGISLIGVVAAVLLYPTIAGVILLIFFGVLSLWESERWFRRVSDLRGVVKTLWVEAHGMEESAHGR